jgi:cytochrome c553
MRASRIVSLLAKSIAAVAALALLLLACVYGVSEWKIRRAYDAPLEPLRAPSPPDPVEGMRMAKIVGCWAGCHGMEGQGGTEDIEGIVRHTAPTLSAVLPLYSDPELVRLIRYGVKRDGRSAVGMISFVFWPLSEQSLADIIAHLRAQPAHPPVPRRLELPLRGRIAIATGEWQVSAEQVDRSRPRWGELPRETPFERGRYYASITCAECHGVDYGGNALEGAPSLAILAAYTPDQFHHLMRTGEPIGGRDLGFMSEIAREAFFLFTDEEIADLYAFLRRHHGL